MWKYTVNIWDTGAALAKTWWDGWCQDAGQRPERFHGRRFAKSEFWRIIGFWQVDKNRGCVLSGERSIPTCVKVNIITLCEKPLQSCPTLCDPTDSSPPGSPVPGILQARTLEWAAVAFSDDNVKEVKRTNYDACIWEYIFSTRLLKITQTKLLICFKYKYVISILKIKSKNSHMQKYVTV